jgi:hypothetical protein
MRTIRFGPPPNPETADAQSIRTPASEMQPSARELDRLRPSCLRVMPRPRGSWIVANERGAVLSEHATATDAETAALGSLCEGHELLVFDRYHRCHRRSAPRVSRQSPRAASELSTPTVTRR